MSGITGMLLIPNWICGRQHWQHDHPELYGDIRADYLTALANAKKKQGGMLNSLMDISLRKVFCRLCKKNDLDTEV